MLLLELGAYTLAPSWGDDGRTAQELATQQDSRAYEFLLEKMELQREQRERPPVDDDFKEQ